MVLESLFPEKRIKNKPIDMLILSFIIALVAMFTAYFVFPAYAGIIAPLITALGMAPLIYRIFQEEEEEIERVIARRLSTNFFARYGDVVLLFSLFFIGNFIAIFSVALLLPDALIQKIFEPQFSDIAAVQALVNASGAAIKPTLMKLIIINNIKVMLFAFALSFLFGTGATFILSWNASILALFLANYVREGLYHSFLLKSTGIFPHAAIELTAYFLAGIAGGILSAGMVREQFGSDEFKLILRDSLLLLILAALAIFTGAFVEVGGLSF